jgi:hypothetical protein
MMTVPGMLMLSIGFPLVVSQLAGSVTIGSVRLDIHFMILGMTLSLLGMAGASLGLIVGAAMATGKVRHIRFLSNLHRWYTFDNIAMLAATLLLVGFAADAYVLGYWLYYKRGVLTPKFTRLTLFGLTLLTLGCQLGLSALLLGTTGSAVGTAPIRKLLGEPLKVFPPRTDVGAAEP